MPCETPISSKRSRTGTTPRPTSLFLDNSCTPGTNNNPATCTVEHRRGECLLNPRKSCNSNNSIMILYATTSKPISVCISGSASPVLHFKETTACRHSASGGQRAKLMPRSGSLRAMQELIFRVPARRGVWRGEGAADRQPTRTVLVRCRMICELASTSSHRCEFQ